MKEILKAINNELIEIQNNILPFINIDEKYYSRKNAIEEYQNKVSQLRKMVNNYLDFQLEGFEKNIN